MSALAVLELDVVWNGAIGRQGASLLGDRASVGALHQSGRRQEPMTADAILRTLGC
jgi:hypothetical protein